MDKRELIKNVEQALNDIKHYVNTKGVIGIGLNLRLEEVKKLINQLDEPKPHLGGIDWLKKEMDQKAFRDTFGNDMILVSQKHFHDLIDQLDEPEKPVVPEFVADFIKDNKGRLNVYGGLNDVQNNKGSEVWEWVFYNHNQDEFAEAWLAYPNIKVEKEKKYRVLDKEGRVLLRKYGEVVRRVTSIVEPNQYPESERGVLALTEKEIKNYDERYFAFAVPVEEEEE